MIWLTWRQHRKQALVTAIGLLALAALLLPSGLAMHHDFTANGLARCLRSLGHAELTSQAPPRCGEAFNHFNNQYRNWASVGVLLVILPLMLGLFWGAPLVARELDQGTHRLIWTQGVSRRRWALVKFGLVGGVVTAVAMLYGAAVSWWIYPLSNAGQNSRFQLIFFDMQGLVPIGYTVFAVALGIYAGTVMHKVLPAMAATLGGFLAVRIAVTVLARAHYLPPKTLAFPVQGGKLAPNPATGDWVLQFGVRDASGRMLVSNAEVGCAGSGGGPGGGGADGGGAGDPGCGSEFGGVSSGAYNWRLYQPGDRFWIFQGIETGLFLALAVVLLMLALRQIRRIA